MMIGTAIGLVVALSAAGVFDYLLFSNMAAFYLDRDIDYSVSPFRLSAAAVTTICAYFTATPASPSIYVLPTLIALAFYAGLMMRDFHRAKVEACPRDESE